MTGAERNAPGPAEGEGVLLPQPRSGQPPLVRAGCAAGEALLYSDLAEQELLARLRDGDPSGLYERGVRKALEEALLIDGERLFDRVLLRVAGVAKPRDRTQLGSWIDSMIVAAITEVLTDDLERIRTGNTAPDERLHAFMSQVFGIQASDTLRAAVAFNGLPRGTRRAFTALAIENQSIAECVEANLGTRDTLGGLACSGLDAIMGRDVRPQSAPARMQADK